MKWLRKGAYNTVKELVQANTGMSANDLAYDARSYYYPGIKEAAELFMDHIKHGSKILVWCDYDTDGVDCKFIMSYTLARPMKIRNIEILVRDATVTDTESSHLSWNSLQVLIF